jgi:putative oxidoreductase
MSVKKVITFLIKLAIGGFFIYAAVGKIINPDEFARSIHNYRMMPPDIINLMAITIPWIEIIAAVCLIIGFKTKGANLIIAGMLVVFIIALSSAYARGLNINCGCFSSAAALKSDLLMRIIEDVLMLIGCLIIAIVGEKRSNRGWR